MGEAIQTWLGGQFVSEDDPYLGASASKPLRNKLIFDVPITSLSWRLFWIKQGHSEGPCWEMSPLLPIANSVVCDFSPKYWVGEALQNRLDIQGGFLCSVFSQLWPPYHIPHIWPHVSNSSLLGQRNQFFKGMKELHFGKRLGAVFKHTAALPWMLSAKRTSASKHLCFCPSPRGNHKCWSLLLFTSAQGSSWSHAAGNSSKVPLLHCLLHSLFMEAGEQNHKQVYTFVVFLL